MSVYRIWLRDAEEAHPSAKWVVALSPESAVRRFLRDRTREALKRDYVYEEVVVVRAYNAADEKDHYHAQLIGDRLRVTQIPSPWVQGEIDRVMAEILEEPE